MIETDLNLAYWCSLCDHRLWFCWQSITLYVSMFVSLIFSKAFVNEQLSIFWRIEMKGVSRCTKCPIEALAKWHSTGTCRWVPCPGCGTRAPQRWHSTGTCRWVLLALVAVPQHHKWHSTGTCRWVPCPGRGTTAPRRWRHRPAAGQPRTAAPPLAPPAPPRAATALRESWLSAGTS